MIALLQPDKKRKEYDEGDHDVEEDDDDASGGGGIPRENGEEGKAGKKQRKKADPVRKSSFKG